MTDPDQDLLTTTEGVDEGSADSTAEDESTAGAAPVKGAGSDGPLDVEASAAPPVPLDGAPRPDSPGQQLAAGEG